MNITRKNLMKRSAWLPQWEKMDYQQKQISKNKPNR